MAVDWSQFKPVSGPVDWSQFKPYEEKKEGAFARAGRIARDEDGGVLAAAGSLIEAALPDSRAGRDTTVAALKSAVGVPQSAIGLIDIASGGRFGRALEQAGIDPNAAQRALDELYSPETQAAKREVQAAEGFTDTAGAMLRNPSTILTGIGESIAPMFAGGLVGRGAVALAPRLSPAAGAAIGEGALMAGQSASQIRGQTEDGLLTPTQSALAAGTGVVGGLIGRAGGALSNRAGIGDVDTAIVQGGLAEAAKRPGFLARTALGAGIEGGVEEMPQSVVEQAAQNVALGKPWDEGLGSAAAQGLVVGAPFGAVGANLSRPTAPQAPAPAADPLDAQTARMTAATDAYLNDRPGADTIASIVSKPTVDEAIDALGAESPSMEQILADKRQRAAQRVAQELGFAEQTDARSADQIMADAAARREQATLAAQQELGLSPTPLEASTPVEAPVEGPQLTRGQQDFDARRRAAAAVAQRDMDLSGQAAQAFTQADREGLEAQRQVALERAQSPVADRSSDYVDLTPMDARAARARLAVLRDQVANEGGDALGLVVMTHPEVRGAYAIGTRPVVSLEAPAAAAPAPVSAAEAQNRIESAELGGREQQRKRLDEARQIVVTRALKNVEERNGVASPQEAQIFQEAGLGRPYDSVDESLGPRPGLVLPQMEERGPATTGAGIITDSGTTFGRGERQPRGFGANASLDFAPTGLQVTTSPGAAPDTRVDGVEPTGLVRAFDEQAPVGGRSATRQSEIPAVPGIPGVADTLNVNAAGQVGATEAQNQTLLGEPRDLGTEMAKARAEAGYQAPPAAPRPQKIGGVPASTMSDAQLQEVAANAKLPAITRRGAQIELGYRRSEQQAAPVTAAPPAAPDIKASAKRSPQDVLSSVARSRESKVGRPVQMTVVDTNTLPAQRGTGAGALSRQAHTIINNVSRVFGKKLVVFESDDATAPDGFYSRDDPDTIYLNRNSETPHLVVFGHELLHSLRKDNEAAYQALVKTIKLKEGADISETPGIRGDIEEFTADLMGNQFRDNEFWVATFRDIIASKGEQQGRQVVTRLAAAAVRAVNGLMKALGRAPGYNTDEMVANLGEVKAALRSALSTYAKDRYGAAVAMERERVAAAPAPAPAAAAAPATTVAPTATEDAQASEKRVEGPFKPARTMSELEGVLASEKRGEGELRTKLNKDGSLTVYGDPDQVRAMLPEGIVGRNVQGGVSFTASQAPRVRAAVEGRRVAYSRQGEVTEKLPMRDGKYIGAPEKYNTPAKISTLRRNLRQLTMEGQAGRYWYENSSREVLAMVGGNVQEARKFVALLSIYSPQAKVDANSTFALRAWAQYKAGQPISVKTGVQDRKATAALQDVDAFWSGEKTGNFFFNLLREIDPSTAGKQGATIDMWMMRAAEYSSDAPTSTQYAFMENETNRIAREMGWEPQQVQAAIWVAMKARMENAGVKKRTEASSEKKGWIRYDYPIKNGRPTKTRVILDAQKHRDNWLKHAFQHDPTKSDTQGAKFDFSDGLRRHIGQLSWEARPGRTTGVLPGVNDAPYEQQVEFQQAVQKALLDDDGIDLLAYKLGLLVDGPDILAPGVWQGEIAAGMQKQVGMAPAKGDAGKTSIDPAQALAMDAYASVLGMLLRQEGVGYHRPFYKGNRASENAVNLSIGRTFTPAEAQALWSEVDRRMRAAGVADWENGAGLISSPDGMRVVNFGAVGDNLAFQSMVASAAEALPVESVELQRFSTDGNLVMNNWVENPNGEGYRSRVRETYGPDLLDWAGTVLAPRVQSVFDEFSSRYGWGDAGDVAALFPAGQQPAAEVKASEKRSPLGFYSALASGVDGIKTGAAPAQGWKDAIKGLVNKGQVKADEVEWSGINDWLDLQQGKVSKDQVSEYLKQGGVQVQETVLGSTAEAGFEEQEDGTFNAYIGDRFVGNYPTEQEALYAAQGEEVSPARYSQYTLPGGENYREVLLTLPMVLTGMDSVRVEELDRLIDEKAGPESGYGSLPDDERRAIRVELKPLRDERTRLWDKRINYKSRHWDQPNVLAHIRVNDRTDADGKRVLFVEEIQSDWGQGGKKKGFANPGLPPGHEVRRTTVKNPLAGLGGNAGSPVERYAVFGPSGNKLTSDFQTEDGARSAFLANSPQIPAAPFVTKTEGWLNLALKRVMVMAAEGGYDKVAFVNGEQSADRYDLSKQIEMVTAYKETGGGFRISATDNNGNTLPAQKAKDEAELEGIVGKELATKIASQKGVVEQYSGLDLKVGGEGMKTFYDTIVPTALKKLLPKVGGEGMTDVRVLDGSARNPSQMALDELPGATPEQLEWQRRYDELMEAGDYAGIYDLEKAGRPEMSPDQERALLERRVTTLQPGFDVTPAMREKVSEGLPLFSEKRNIFNQRIQPAWSVAPDTKLDAFLYKLQDKQIDLKRITQAIKDAIGGLAEKWDAYLAEELYHGRTAKQTKGFLQDEMKPLVDAMTANRVTMPELEEYLHNRHAEERNRQIATINPNLPDAGSGIATADARRYLAGLPANQRQRYEALARQVDAINKKTRQLLVSSGLEKQDTIDAWERTYPTYMPLFREDADYDGSQSPGGTGMGFSVRGPSSKRATGSADREVVDILANVALMRERTITRAEKARVGRALYGLAVQNQNPGFWLAIDPKTPKDIPGAVNTLISMGMTAQDARGLMQQPTVPYVDPRTGLVTYRVNPLLRNAEHVMSVRVDGEDKMLVFNPRDERAQRMVTSLKNLDAQQLGGALSAAAFVSRWFAQVNTQYNPVFGAINLIRDVGGAAFNLTTTDIADRKAQVMAGVGPALVGIYQDLRKNRTGQRSQGQWAQLWEEFQREGGQTGFRDMFSSSDERAVALQRMLDPSSWAESPLGKFFTANGTLKAPMEVVRKGAAPVFNWLSDYNETLENAVRLSAYKAAKDKGLSNAKAASIAKNLTVNFNRKGQVGVQMGALYAFFNASVQGTARLAETLGSGRDPNASAYSPNRYMGKTGQRIIAGGLLLGVMQAVALAMAGFDEDEPPEFIKERNLVIPLDWVDNLGGPNLDGKFLTIPMPLGLNVIPNTGRVLTEWWMSGFKDTPKRIASITGSFLEMFNPIGNAGWSVQTIAPTFADPLVALSENRDWTGKPIAKEDRSGTDPTPGYTRAKDTASIISKGIAYALNAVSGGTDYKPGVVSPTPDQIDYLIGQVTGGVGREVLKVSQAVESGVTGEDLPTYKIPVAGRFYGDTKELSAVSSRYYDNLTRMNQHENEIKGRAADRVPIGDYFEDNPEARLVSLSNRIEREVSDLRRRKRELIKREASKESIKMVEEAIRRRMQSLNDAIERAQERTPAAAQ